MLDAIFSFWPWYVAGPLIGLFVPALLIAGNRIFGFSSNLRHICSAAAGLSARRPEYFDYDWKSRGLWNLVFLAGVVIGGAIARPEAIAISDATRQSLAQLGLSDFSGLAPAEVFSWQALGTLRGFVSIVGGGFLVGFGTAWAAGCTSGHAISGLANFQRSSLIAVCGFFAGGLAATFFLLPVLF
jgi:uncharacterized protein